METFFEFCKEESSHFEDYLEDFVWWYLREDKDATKEVLQGIGMSAANAEKLIQKGQSEPDDRAAARMFGDALKAFPAGTKEHKAVEDFFFDMMYNSTAGSDFYDMYQHLLAEETQKGVTR